MPIDLSTVRNFNDPPSVTRVNAVSNLDQHIQITQRKVLNIKQLVTTVTQSDKDAIKKMKTNLKNKGDVGTVIEKDKKKDSKAEKKTDSKVEKKNCFKSGKENCFKRGQENRVKSETENRFKGGPENRFQKLKKMKRRRRLEYRRNKVCLKEHWILK